MIVPDFFEILIALRAPSQSEMLKILHWIAKGALRVFTADPVYRIVR